MLPLEGTRFLGQDSSKGPGKWLQYVVCYLHAVLIESARQPINNYTTPHPAPQDRLYAYLYLSPTFSNACALRGCFFVL